MEKAVGFVEVMARIASELQVVVERRRQNGGSGGRVKRRRWSSLRRWCVKSAACEERDDDANKCKTKTDGITADEGMLKQKMQGGATSRASSRKREWKRALTESVGGGRPRVAKQLGQQKGGKERLRG